ncbi:hypothetical protein DL770_002495 [Monosporascus sp. CRB-9-2]|nr:hypothetical protein DL770_002495 [Monosporascus sp. CRB-9-2]
MVARREKHRLHLRGDSLFRVEAQRIYDNLTQLKNGESKAMWSPVGVCQGSLQAKAAAFPHLHAMTFGWLDSIV